MKRKLFLLASFIFLAVILTGCSLPFSKRSMAALQVSSQPKATLFLDGEHKGATPFSNEEIEPGEYTLKLVPESEDILYSPWETRVKLTQGVLTVVNYEFGLTDDESASEILTLEPISDKETAEIVLVSSPDGAVVSLDGEPQGFAPLTLPNVSEGDHEILVSLPGYKERQIKAKAVKGYKLSISVQLALDETESESTDEEGIEEGVEEGDLTPTPTFQPEADAAEEDIDVNETPTPTPTETETETEISDSDNLERPYVEIDSPDVGWVRVRKNPCTTDEDRCEELAKAEHGNQYKLLDSNDVGWYKIQFDEEASGWISGRYAERYD